MITLINTPQLIQPVYNPIYITVSSDQTAQESFKFVFDLYVNGVFTNRDKLPARPATTQAVYSPARILESYVSFDLDQNSIGPINNVNSIDKYEVRCFEEYIVYWNFFNTEVDSYTSTTFTVLHGTTKHNYSVGDYIYVKTNSTTIFPIDAVYTIQTVVDPYKVIINKTFVSSATNPGKTVYADRRKQTFPDVSTNVVTNPTMITANGQWPTYGPDSCNVFAGLQSHFLKLIVPDVSCGTAYQVVTNSSTVLVPGRKYKVDVTLAYVTNPSNVNFYISSNVGGTTSTIFTKPAPGVLSSIVTCGAGTSYAINLDFTLANTATYGTHSLSISQISITEVAEQFSGYDFNAVIQYEEVPVWDYNKYMMSSTTPGLMLSKAPNVQLCNYEDRGSVSFFNIKTYSSSNIYKIQIDLYDAAGTHTQKRYTSANLNILGTINTSIVHLGVFPWNINQLSTLNGDGNIISSTIVKYTVTILLDDGVNPLVNVLQPRYFQVSNNCSRFNPVRFMFLNSLGGFDYYTATLLGRTTLTSTRDNMTHTLSQGYVQGDRGRSTINVNAQEAYIINTNWMTEETAHWLTREFFLSNEIYTLDNTTGLITPIILDLTTMEDKKRVNDKLLNYTFNYSKAVTINTIRG